MSAHVKQVDVVVAKRAYNSAMKTVFACVDLLRLARKGYHVTPSLATAWAFLVYSEALAIAVKRMRAWLAPAQNDTGATQNLISYYESLAWISARDARLCLDSETWREQRAAFFAELGVSA